MPAPALTGLVALAAISNDALKGAVLPTRLKLLNWGENHTVSKGVVKVGPGTVKALAANQARYGFETIALDYGHNSLPGHPNFQPDPRKVAAYGRPAVIEGDGLYLESLSFTPSGRENAAEYHDLSPTPLLDAHGEVTFLHSVALCPQGEVHGLSFYSVPADFLALSTQPATTNPMIDLLKKLLKLPADATEADVTKALEAAIAASDKPADDAPATEGLKAMSAATLKALGAIKAELQGEIKALSTRFDGQLREQIVGEATATGRVVPTAWLPNEKGEGGLPLGELKALCATLPVTVPLESRTKHLVPLSADATLQTAAEKEVMRTLNISEDAWKKHAA